VKKMILNPDDVVHVTIVDREVFGVKDHPEL